jgi:CDP-diacylglycerol--serine O-phosphatidyltransferase
MVSAIKFRSFKDLRLNWRTMMLISVTLSVSVAIALEFHISFALGWMLVSYVAIGLIESIFNLSRRALRRGPRSEDEETAPS